MIQALLHKLIVKEDLTAAEMTQLMSILIEEKTTPAQIAALLTALRMKGETITELTAAARVMRERALAVSVTENHLVDIVGTGGDHASLFNISTTSAFVAAAAGAHVAKHNNRAVSSTSGSADVLTQAGINLALTPQQIATGIHEIGIGFMLAPRHHSCWQKVGATRRELGIRTLFNLLGPLTNPARVPNLLVGVSSRPLTEILAQVFQQLGNHHVLVVHSEDGLDEISIAAATTVTELRQQQINTYVVTPEQFGLQRASLKSLRVTHPQQSLELMEAVFENQESAARDMVLLNAGAALYASGHAADWNSGVAQARTALAKGMAKKIFTQFKTFTQQYL